MFRHPHYLEVPWDISWRQETTKNSQQRWWLIAVLVAVAIFMIGVGTTGGLE